MRLSKNREFQAMLHKQEETRSRLSLLPPNSIDETFSEGQDMQMIEAVNIVTDMILLEVQAHPVPSLGQELQRTGSD